MDGRIVDCVDPCRAATMVRGRNVKAVRSRKGDLVRVIVEPMVLGKGDIDAPTSHMDSRRAHKKEALFNADDATHCDIPGMPFVFVPKTIPKLADVKVENKRRAQRKPSRRKR